MNSKRILTAKERRHVVELLAAEEASCVVRNGDCIRIFRGRGVSDLVRLLHEEPGLLAGAFVADKIVGKGAAALMVAGGVGAVHTEVASQAAAALLREAGIELVCTEEVPHIINRAGTGICPVEALCAPCRTAAECLPRIEEFVARMAAQHA